ncbi:uncharacterized protein TRIADDRAFT_33402 [Trichoplax adhaerens]|uniref:Integrator complex subunit 7 N-terminal domain-containing protein n=1 Tax=Trichoplax adhaerens TaxID=10228 RepID=B3SCN1_TRIAD|nr:hypothetical protein TRIADDRAFT_33402 [Trichoplax adhaerens]EDV19481.1 hypothetical protein TRIADDRAFT_33402 [Trichoplax adhaerens]|eukprot:XP_002117998.1 hypothetical protein TRIADDRAFT_33402 [Trichoplax adhaerens]
MATGGVDWDGSFTHQHDWRDANSAMIELEKGLRSSNIGEQCEAIVRFPKLFEKFPFPILVNSAFMKLTDLFYSGSNFLRLCILQVTKDSRKHLGKILNVEDCVRRLYSVMLSNDPVARAITLRVFGNIASIIAEHKNIHHSIQHSLDSHDHIELEGAILASYRLSAESATFASAICSKIANMIQGMGTSIEVKIKMIRILRYMHHDEESISKARQLCHTLLIAYPGSNFVKITLHVLSLLSIKSVLDISHQISFLLNYLKSDQRLEIRRIAIQDLRLFARKVPHMWNKEDIQGLCEILLSFPQQEIQILILRTLVILAHSVAVKCMAECEGM